MRVSLLVAMFAAILASAAPTRAPAAEVINAYIQTVRVERDDRLAVTEDITVTAEGNQIRRGIYRDFPTVFIDEAGVRRQVGFRVLSVQRDGADEPWSAGRTGNGVRVYIGDEDVFLAPGRYTYRLTYETDRQIRRFPDQDQLFWNVTGNDWAFPIERVEATVILPLGVRAEQTTAYTGYAGGRGEDWTVAEAAGGNELVFAATRRLQPGEGLSIVVAMPPGTIAEPSQADRLGYFYRDNQSTLIALLGLTAVLAYYIYAWGKVGRDPPKGTIIPLFEPPSGISAPLSQYIHERGLTGGGWTALSAAWVALAVKGLVTLSGGKGDDLSIKRTGKGPPGDLPKSEKTLLEWLSGRGGDAVVNRAIGTQVQTLNGKFRTAVSAESRDTFFNNNRGYAVLGVLLSMGALGLAAALSVTGAEDFASVFPLIFVLVFGLIGINGIEGLRRADGWAAMIGSLVPAVAGIAVAIIGAAASLGIAVSTGASPFFPAIALVLIGVNLLFFHLLAAPTVNGRKLMDKIEGLILYMTVAEQKRLNMPGLPPVTPSRYETLLPYAIALGVEEPWTAALNRHLAAAAAAGAAVAYSPAWYHGRAGRGIADMSGNLRSMSRSFQSSVPPPKSSSSGFSGSSGSGGGGGGGGGGGW